MKQVGASQTESRRAEANSASEGHDDGIHLVERLIAPAPTAAGPPMPDTALAPVMLALQRSAGNSATQQLARSLSVRRLQRRSLAELPEGVRRRIRVSTRPFDLRPLVGRLPGLFRPVRAGGPPGERIGLPRGVAAQFEDEIPDRGLLRAGLSSVAAWLIADAQVLPQDSTLAFALDLRPFGDEHSLFRFTRTGRTVIVERVAGAGGRPQHPGRAGRAQPDPRSQRFRNFGFTARGWSAEEHQYLLEAIRLVPDAHLAQIRGLRFLRAQGHHDPDAGGMYHEGRHAITMYDRAFREATPGAGEFRRNVGKYAQLGGGLAAEPVRLILHEIGHALDYAPLRIAWAAFEGAGQSPAAQRRLVGVRSPSGLRYRLRNDEWTAVEGPAAAGTIEFRRAASRDARGGGIRVTDYSDTNWEEYFAESFSFYIVDPGLLRTLRPNVYDYFARTFPDQQRPPAQRRPARRAQRRRVPAAPR